MWNSCLSRVATRAIASLICVMLGVAAHATTPTTTSLASTNTNPYSAQSFALTAMVAPSAATGTVIFKDGTATISGCSAVALSSGTATCTTSIASVGTHSITANYGGDATYAASSGSVSEVVKAKTTSMTAVVSSANPAYINNTLTYTATVTGLSPSGSVDFYSNGTKVATVPLSAGQAGYSLSYPSAASRPVYAYYGGDVANAASTSSTLTEVVTNPPATTTTIASSANPVATGLNVTYTATVTGTNSPAGNVTFYSAGASIGVMALNAGQASITYSYASAASRSVYASYGGNSTNAASQSSTITENVLQASTTALMATPTTTPQSQNVTLKATLSPSTATGTVTFMDGASSLGTGTVASGIATLTASFAAAGSHSLTAVYGGNSSFYTSTSSAVTETVTTTQQATTTTLTASANPSAVGTSLTLAATVAGNSPTGTMQFKDGATSLGSPVTLIGGQASLAVTPGASGAHAYSAVYSNDPNNAASTGSITVNVVGNRSTTALTSSATSATPSTSVTLTATITGSSPTGTVTFRDGATQLSAVTPVSGVATLSRTFANGLHSISATYTGDTTNAASTSAAVLVQVSASGTTPPAGAALQVNYQYDAEGNLTQVTDANSATTQQAYDSLSRTTTITQPVPAQGASAPQIGLTYDLRDQPATVKDPRQITTSYATDGLGNTTLLSSHDKGDTTNQYYDNGLLKTSQDARGHVTTYTYDALDRIKTATPDSGTATTFFYDGGTYGKGLLTSMSDESGTSGFGYDGFGVMTSKTQTTGPAGAQKTFSSSYLQGASGSATGKLQTLIYPSHATVTYGYDATGRINSISVLSADGVTVTKVLSGVQYNALNQPVSWIWSAGNVPYQRSFDAYGRLASYPLGNPTGSGNAAGVTRTIAFDAAGRIAGYSHTTPANWDQVFSYDGLDRLTGASLQAGNVYGYAYDATGNRTQTTINGSSYADTVSTTSNRYSSVTDPRGTATQSYDAAGNLTSDIAGTYTYSARGRMSAQTNASGTFSYLYNGLGQRVYKSGPSAVIATGVAYYAYDPQGRLLGEYDANGKAVYETVYLGDMPVAVLTQPALNQTTVSYAYSDHLNTARVLVRPIDQAIVWSWGSTEPFGQSQANPNPSGLGAFIYNPRFPGQVADPESGWFYNWHRDYNPALGRYVQSDPFGLNGGIGTYSYVEGSPLALIDSLGLEPFPGSIMTQGLPAGVADALAIGNRAPPDAAAIASKISETISGNFSASIPLHKIRGVQTGFYVSVKTNDPSGDTACYIGWGYVSRANFSVSTSIQANVGEGSTEGWVAKATGTYPLVRSSVGGAATPGVTGSFTAGPNGWSAAAGPTATSSASVTVTGGYNWVHHH